MAAITGAVLGVGMAAYSVSKGIKDKNDYYDEMNQYERQDIENAFINTQLSTLGSDLIREETGSQAASLVDAAQSAGSRGISSSIPKIQAGLNKANQESAKILDTQNQRREYAIAGDETRLQSIRENRDMQNIGAISSQINAADQNIQNGILGGMSAIMYGARAIGGTGAKTEGEDQDEFLKEELPAASVERIASIDINPYSLPQLDVNFMNRDIWGADPYNKEFYNKYFNV